MGMVTTASTAYKELALEDLRALCTETAGWPGDARIKLHGGWGITSHEAISVTIPTIGNVNCPLAQCK